VALKVVDLAELDNADGYELQDPITLKWLVKELLKFDSTPLASCTDFVRIGSGENTAYLGYVNYITDSIDSALEIDSNVANDVEKLATMAQLSWDGPEQGKSNWIPHEIRNSLDRDEDVVPVGTAAQLDKTPIVDGNDFVEVEFDTPYATANWHFVGSPVISNVVDGTPLGIMVVGLTVRSTDGFTVKLSAPVDSGNYKLEWIVALD
jgi:hypothetical protein